MRRDLPDCSADNQTNGADAAPAIPLVSPAAFPGDGDSGVKAGPESFGVARESPVEESRQALVVEDDEPMARLLAVELSGLGFVCTTAVSAEAALNWLHSHKPDLITLDILLPGLSGWEVLSEVKSNDSICWCST